MEPEPKPRVAPSLQQQRQVAPISRASAAVSHPVSATTTRSTPNLRAPPAQAPRRAMEPLESNRRSLLATTTALVDTIDPRVGDIRLAYTSMYLHPT